MIELLEIHKVNGTRSVIERYSNKYLTKQEMIDQKKELKEKLNYTVYMVFKEIPDDKFWNYIEQNDIKLTEKEISDIENTINIKKIAFKA
jgi:hypothetical protein